MEITEGALAMAAKNKIETEIAGLAEPQTTKRATHPHKYKNQREQHGNRRGCLSYGS